MFWPCLNVQCSVTRRALVNAVVLDRRSWEKGSQFAAIPGFPDASEDTLTLATGTRRSWLGPRELLCEILVTVPELCCPVSDELQSQRCTFLFPTLGFRWILGCVLWPNIDCHRLPSCAIIVVGCNGLLKGC